MTRWVLRSNDRLARGLGIVERLLLSAEALLLVGFAALGLLNTVALVKDTLVGSGDDAVIIAQGIDAAFLAIILLELLHTVLSRGPLRRRGADTGHRATGRLRTRRRRQPGHKCGGRLDPGPGARRQHPPLIQEHERVPSTCLHLAQDTKRRGAYLCAT